MFARPCPEGGATGSSRACARRWRTARGWTRCSPACIARHVTGRYSAQDTRAPKHVSMTRRAVTARPGEREARDELDAIKEQGCALFLPDRVGPARYCPLRHRHLFLALVSSSKCVWCLHCDGGGRGEGTETRLQSETVLHDDMVCSNENII